MDWCTGWRYHKGTEAATHLCSSEVALPRCNSWRKRYERLSLGSMAVDYSNTEYYLSFLKLLNKQYYFCAHYWWGQAHISVAHSTSSSTEMYSTYQEHSTYQDLEGHCRVIGILCLRVGFFVFFYTNIQVEGRWRYSLNIPTDNQSSLFPHQIFRDTASTPKWC